MLTCGMFPDSSRESSGGLAFDVILKPAIVDNPPVLRNKSPPSRPLSQVEIEKKLLEAEMRKLVIV